MGGKKKEIKDTRLCWRRKGGGGGGWYTTEKKAR